MVIFSLTLPFTLTSFVFGDLQLADPDIEWGVNEGETYTWVVKESNVSLGFLPVNSTYEITITSIRAMLGGDATELNATIKEFNSQTELTTTLLDNQTFIHFNSATNTTTLYTNITKHCFFIPPDYYEDFAEGLFDFYGSFFYDMYTPNWGEFAFFGQKDSLVYMWVFYKNGISELAVVFLGDVGQDPVPRQYLLVLLKTDSDPTISFGNYFLIIGGLTVLSLIYVYMKKINKKS
ncbi:MAG: hypothetical protein ACFE9N_03590 [Promethearchaeota archaeon]